MSGKKRERPGSQPPGASPSHPQPKPSLATPHDALFKAVLGVPANAASVLKSALPEGLARAIDFASLTLCAGSYVDAALAKSESDLLFRFELSGTRAYAYFLYEHWSHSDREAMLRLLRYMVRIWTRQHREEPSSALPAIVPVILHHSERGWKAHRTFAGLFDPRVRRLAELRPFIPDFTVVLDDISHASDTELLGRAGLSLAALVFLFALRDARNTERLAAHLPNWSERLDQLAQEPDEEAAVQVILRYLVLVTGNPALLDQIARIAPHTRETAMTIAEQLEVMFRNKGRVEGRAEGERLMIEKLLTAKFGPLPASVKERLERAEPAELEAMAERVLWAAKLDAMFET